MLMVVILAVIAAVFLAAPANATTLEKLTIDQLAQRAAAIVVAETSSVSGELVTLGDGPAARSYPQTRVSARVVKVLKGDVGRTVSATVLGGTVNGITALVEGMPTFTPGETSLLFLDDQGRVIGGCQGKLLVVAGMVPDLGQSLLLTEYDIATGLGQASPAGEVSRPGPTAYAPSAPP